jgi:methyl-accepting chemotaxis protein
VKLKIGSKVITGFAFVLLLLLIMSITSIVSTRSVAKGINTVDVVNERLSLQKDIDSNFNGAVGGIRGYIAYGTAKFKDEYNSQMKLVLDAEKKLLEVSAPEKKAEVQKLIDVTSSYNQGITNDLMPAIERQYKATDPDVIQAEQQEVSRIAGTLVPVTNQLKEIVNSLVTSNQKVFEENIKAAGSGTSRVIWTIIIISVIALLIGLVLSLVITKSVSGIIKSLLSESGRLTEAAKEGKLDARGDVNKIDPEFQGVIQGINDTLDAVIGPLNVAAEYIDRISKGDTPPKITDNYNGDFNEIKNNLNMCIDTIGVLVEEVGVVIGAGSEGKLDQRANADRAAGVWRKILRGVNNAMDGVIGPLNVAAEYVDRIAKGEIPPRIIDAYNGDFNEIKNNLNTLIDVTAENKERAEEMLRIKGAVEASAAPIVITDKKGVNLLSQNKAFNELFGYNIDQINAAGGLPAIFVNAATGRDCWKSIMSGKTWQNELELRTRDNRTIPSILCADAVKNEKGEIIGCFGVINDITDQKVVLKAVQELVEKAKAGDLSARADVAASGDYKRLVDGINQMLDAVIEPLNMSAEYIDRIAKGDTPPEITEEYKGDFNEIKNNLNTLIGTIHILVDEIGLVIGAGSEGKLDQRANADRAQGVWRKILRGVNNAMDGVIGPLNVAAEYVDRIARGDTPPEITEEYKGDFNLIKDNLNTCIRTIHTLVDEVGVVIGAGSEGKLDQRANADRAQGVWRKILRGVNNAMDGVIGPLNVAAEYVDRIARGDTPPEITEEYKGDFNEIKNNLNTLIGTIHVLVDEVGVVIGAGSEGKLDQRANADRAQGVWRKILRGVNNAMDGVITPLNVAAEYVDRIAKGDIPPKITDTYNGDFNEIKNNLNSCIDTISGLLKEAESLIHSVKDGNLDDRGNAAAFAGDWGELVKNMNGLVDAVSNPIDELKSILSQMAVNDYSQSMDKEYSGAWNDLKVATNNVRARLLRVVEVVSNISNGNLVDLTELKKVGKRSENDQLIPALVKMMEAIQSLVADANTLAKATVDGNLEARADAARHNGDFRMVIEGMNGLMEAVTEPIEELIAVLSQVAVNDLSKKMDKNYSGSWNDIKHATNEVHQRLTNIRNTIIKVSKGDLSDAEMYKKVGRRSEKDELVPGFIRMHDAIQKLLDDANTLAGAAVEGKLGTRAEAAQHEGEYRKIIEGVNNMMDAVINPINEAADCLKGMAEGDLDVRMNGKYQGDHAIIKDALNSSLEALNEIIKKEAVRCLQEMAKGNLDVAVTGNYKGDYGIIKEALNASVNDLNEILGQINVAIEQVNTGAQQVSDSSQALSQGAAESASTMAQITSSMQQMNDQTKQNAENATQANQLATQARANAERGNEQMGQMVKAMGEINESAANISKIIKAIDEIAFQTNLLALNAAVEAARAGKHGKGFTVVAEEVRNLAQRSAKAAKETAEMIEGSIKKTDAGTKIAEETSKALEEIVLGVSKVTDFISEIASASKEQALGIGQINEGLGQVDQVTQQNSASSEELAAASEEMSSQSEMVRQMLGKFKLKRQAGGGSYGAGQVSAGKPYLAHKQGRSAAQKSRLEVAAAAAGGGRLNPEDVISLDDMDYGKF